MQSIFIRIALAAVAAAILGGCASDARNPKGLQWVVEQQQERDRLEAQGFPQYSYD